MSTIDRSAEVITSLEKLTALLASIKADGDYKDMPDADWLAHRIKRAGLLMPDPLEGGSSLPAPAPISVTEWQKTQRSERACLSWVTILDFLMNRGLVDFSTINDLLLRFEEEGWTFEKLEEECERQL